MTAHVIPVTRRQSAAITTSSPQELHALHAHQAAENALSMALHYLRTGAGNIPGAARKAVQALAAINTLQASAAGAGARDQAAQGV